MRFEEGANRRKGETDEDRAERVKAEVKFDVVSSGIATHSDCYPDIHPVASPC